MYGPIPSLTPTADPRYCSTPFTSFANGAMPAASTTYGLGRGVSVSDPDSMHHWTMSSSLSYNSSLSLYSTPA